MTFLYISYFAIFHVMIKAFPTEEIPPPILEVMLSHVNTLLTGIKDKIAVQRRLLSQLDDENKYNFAVPVVTNEMYQSSKIKKPIRTELDLDIPPPPISLTSTLDPAAPKQSALDEQKSLVPQFVDFEADPFDDAIFNTPKPTPEPENIFDKTPEKIEMLEFMKNHSVGYCFGSSKGLFEMIVKKPENMLEALFYAFSEVIRKMVIQNKLYCLDALFATRLMRLSLVVRITPVSQIKVFVSNMLDSLMEVDSINPAVRDPMLKYDRFFNDEEGERLLDSIVMLHNYNSSIESHAHTAEPLTESYVNAVLAPTKRYCGTYELKALNHEMNNAYSYAYPNSRKNFQNLMNSTTDQTFKVPSRRSSNEDAPTEFIKIAKHFILKHPSLFSKFFDHYKNSVERQRHDWKRENII